MYGLAALLAALTFVAIWIYAAQGRRLLRGDLGIHESAVITFQTLAGPTVYLAAIGVAFSDIEPPGAAGNASCRFLWFQTLEVTRH